MLGMKQADPWDLHLAGRCPSKCPFCAEAAKPFSLPHKEEANQAKEEESARATWPVLHPTPFAKGIEIGTATGFSTPTAVSGRTHKLEIGALRLICEENKVTGRLKMEVTYKGYRIWDEVWTSQEDFERSIGMRI